MMILINIQGRAFFLALRKNKKREWILIFEGFLLRLIRDMFLRMYRQAVNLRMIRFVNLLCLMRI